MIKKDIIRVIFILIFANKNFYLNNQVLQALFLTKIFAITIP